MATTTTYKGNLRTGRVIARSDQARGLIKQALAWENDDEAIYVLASILVEARNARQLAAVWRELSYLDRKSVYGARAAKVVQGANDALAKELV